MRVVYDYCWLRDLREMSTYERYVKPAVVDGLGGVKLSLSWHYPTKMSLGSALSHKLDCLKTIIKQLKFQCNFFHSKVILLNSTDVL